MDAALRCVVLGIALGCAPAHGETTVASLGKERAAASALRWEVREAGHPMLGPIRFAVLRTPIATRAGNARVSSNIYVSCERNTGKIAVELANGRTVDDPGGLKPRRMPRLTCNTVVDGRLRSEALDAHWIVNELGDAMARGFFPFSLRACASIGVSQEVELPSAERPRSVRIDFEIAPYARELDAVFATCGEPSAYAATPDAPAPVPQPDASGWSVARVTSSGRTNVRERPSVRSALVVRLYPGDVILIRKSDDEWWRARSRRGARMPFEGYIRRDRIVLP